MIDIRQLDTLTANDAQRLIRGYTSEARYHVTQHETATTITFSLEWQPLPRPYVKQFDINLETVERYAAVAAIGYSFGAYDGDRLVGLLLGEPHWWNRTLWVYEFHVDPAYQRQGIGQRLMDAAAEKSKIAGLRSIVCETQTTNAPAIQAYRQLGFRLEGFDLSYYTNEDWPDSEMALFMKRRL